VITYDAMTPRDWSGSSYDRVSAPMAALGRAVLDRLRLRGNEVVLDAGCGSGRVTEALLERLPDGRVIAVDASASMVAAARERLGDRADVRQADLLELELGEPVDAVLSTATFHWIGDHDRLYACLRAALRPGGQLVAQCGGEGNIARLRTTADEIGRREPFAPSLADWRGPWNYTSAEQATATLQSAGFVDVSAWLAPASVTPEDPHEYLRTINLGAQLEQLPEELRDPFVDAVVAELGEPLTLDYVRLNIDATAGA
jgi:trans-aconitate 2-methyltransferase